MAIEQGLTILSWFENMQSKEIPPERLWADTKGLEEWWKSIEANKSDGFSSTGSEDETPELVANDLARTLKD